jgi:hypothetical protein
VSLAGALAFALASVFVLATVHSTMATVSGVVGLLFFGACAVAFMGRLRDTAVIVVDDRGIRDRRVGALIAWESVLDASVPKTLGGGAAVALRVRSSEEILTRCRPLYRRLAAANKALGVDQLPIDLAGLDADAHALADVIVKEVARRRAP